MTGETTGNIRGWNGTPKPEAEPMPLPDHLREANGMADVIIHTYTPDQQNEMISFIRDRLIMDRKARIEQVQKEMDSLHDSYERLVK